MVIVRENMEKLRRHGYRFLEPKESLLACGDVGKGALADVERITAAVLDCLERGEQA
ncbi:hypothetical protein SDC9_121788 [bioreactor metagenome]|uniref:Uncharacterized protein n=1 Tax=bioreactor metagenome TaxID=1076179 RepID=A0A645CCX7_9ZZZZ